MAISVKHRENKKKYANIDAADEQYCVLNIFKNYSQENDELLLEYILKFINGLKLL